LGQSPHADAQHELLLALATATPPVIGEIDQRIWDALTVDLADLEAHPLIGQRVLGYAGGGRCTWASSPTAQPDVTVRYWRSLADVVRWAPWDDELQQSAVTVLKCEAYRGHLSATWSEVMVATNAARQAADREAAVVATRQNAWLVSTNAQLAERGEVDHSIGKLSPPEPDYSGLAPFSRELDRINAVARAVDQRERQALETMHERAEIIVFGEDGP